MGYDDSECPCEICTSRDNCDPLEATYCCTLCRWQNEEPDCGSCDPWDI